MWILLSNFCFVSTDCKQYSTKKKAKLSVAVRSINNAIKTESKPKELNVVCEHQQEQFLEISINGNVEAFNAGFKKIFYGGILILRYYCFI